MTKAVNSPLEGTIRVFCLKISISSLLLLNSLFGFRGRFLPTERVSRPGTAREFSSWKQNSQEGRVFSTLYLTVMPVSLAQCLYFIIFHCMLQFTGKLPSASKQLMINFNKGVIMHLITEARRSLSPCPEILRPTSRITDTPCFMGRAMDSCGSLLLCDIISLDNRFSTKLAHSPTQQLPCHH